MLTPPGFPKLDDGTSSPIHRDFNPVGLLGGSSNMERNVTKNMMIGVVRCVVNTMGKDFPDYLPKIQDVFLQAEGNSIMESCLQG